MALGHIADQYVWMAHRMDELDGPIAHVHAADKYQNIFEEDRSLISIIAPPLPYPDSVVGQISKARSFWRDPDALFTTDRSDGFALVNFLTVEVWAKIDNIVANMVILTNQAANGSSSTWRLWVTMTGRLQFQVMNSLAHPAPNTYTYFNYDVSGHVGSWHHYAVTADPLGTGLLYLYVDGQQVDFAAVGVEGALGKIVDTDHSLLLGAAVEAVWPEWTFALYFRGEIDDFRISGVARSATEIAESYARGTRANLISATPLDALRLRLDFDKAVADNILHRTAAPYTVTAPPDPLHPGWEDWTFIPEVLDAVPDEGEGGPLSVVLRFVEPTTRDHLYQVSVAGLLDKEGDAVNVASAQWRGLESEAAKEIRRYLPQFYKVP